jgi:endonuclease/exonuclease/phosphatase family metal-dependent hydrolase
MIKLVNFGIFVLSFLLFFLFFASNNNDSFFNMYKKEKIIETQTISLLTYNIRSSNLDYGRNGWDNRKNILLHELTNKVAADVMGFQEALPIQIDFIKEKLLSYQVTCLNKDSNKTFENLAIFYNKFKFDLIEENYFWLSETPTVEYSSSWDAKFPRLLSYIHLRFKNASNYEIIVANTHFDHMSPYARVKSAELVTNYFNKKLIHKKVSLFLLGDFNEPNNMKTQNIFKNDSYIDVINSCESKISCKAIYKSNSYHHFYGRFVNYPLLNFFPYYKYKKFFGYYPEWQRHHIDWIMFKNYNSDVSLNTNLIEMYQGPEIDYFGILWSTLKDIKNWRQILKIYLTFPSDHFPIIAVLDIENIK